MVNGEQMNQRYNEISVSNKTMACYVEVAGFDYIHDVYLSATIHTVSVLQI